MDSVVIIGACLTILLVCALSRPGIILYFRQPLIALACLIFILCLIFFSGTAVKAAARGLSLWVSVVLPSLFPFFVASEILNSTGFVRASGYLFEPAMRPIFNVPGCGSFAFGMGVSSGYPVGAKITVEMRLKNMISKTEAERLLAFTNNSGPLFIIGAVATGMYNMPQIGLFLWGCHILACITVGFLFRFYKGSRKRSAGHAKSSPPYSRRAILQHFTSEMLSVNSSGKTNLGIVLGDAVRNSMLLLIAIGGFIILFSVIINLLLEIGIISELAGIFAVVAGPFGLDKDTIQALLCGFFEITTGTNLASGLADIALPLQLAVTSLIIGWAGLSVHSQVLSIISGTDISIKPYLFGKFLQGVLAAIYTGIGCTIAGSRLLDARAVFLPAGSTVHGLSWTACIQAVVLSIGVLAAFYLTCCIVSILCRIFRQHAASTTSIK